MAVNENNIAEAEQTIQALEQKLNANRSQFGDMGPPSPEQARTQSNLDRLRAEVANYHSTARQTNSQGQLTAPAPTRASAPRNEVGQDGAFWFEPSVEDVQQRLASDPQLAQQLNLTSWTASPDQIASINKDSTAYKVVADHLWNQSAAQAEQSGQGLRRYSSVELTKNPFDYLAGGVLKYAPSVVDAVTKATPLGAAAAGLAKVEDYIGEKVFGEAPPTIPGTAAADDRRYSEVTTPAEIATSFSPNAWGNIAANATAKALNYAGRGVLGKAATSAAGGALGANIEGAASDVQQGIQSGQSVDDILKTAYENAPLRTGVGAVVGSGADLLGQAAGTSTQSLRKSPRGADLVTLENAGGNTSTVSGVTPSPAIKEAVDQSIVAPGKEPGKGIHPSDYAANKVAPKLSDHLKGKARDLYKQIDENLENYHGTPEGQDPRNEKGMALRLTSPVKKVMDMVKQNLRTGDLGKTSDNVPEVAKEMRKFLQNHTEMVRVPEDQVANITKRYGDDAIVMDDKEASQIFGTKKRLKYKNKDVIEAELIDHPDSDAPTDELTGSVVDEPRRRNPNIQEEDWNPFKGDALAESGTVKSNRTPAEGWTPPDGLNSGTPIDGLESGSQPRMLTEGAENKAREEFLAKRQDSEMNSYLDKVKDRDLVRQGQTQYGEMFDKTYSSRQSDNRRAGDLGTKLQSEMDALGNRIGDSANARPGVYSKEYHPSRRMKTVILPAKTNSRQMVELQRYIDTKLQSKLEDTTWLKDLDLELKKTRDYFKPNKYASEKAQLDNGQEVQGLSALQFKHHKANESMQQSLDDTGAGFRNRIHSNVTQYKSGPGRLYKDQELEQAARETGLEQQLREAAGTNVYPQLAARAWAQAGQGPINAVTDFARFRMDPMLRAMGQIEPNPFIPDPNTPAGRIQKYLFEDPTRNALNLTRGLPAARQGDHIAEEYERRQKERN